MKYLLDFDRTLFDTNALVQRLTAAAVDQTQLAPKHLRGMVMKDFLFTDSVPFLQNKKSKDITILTALGTSYGDKILEFQTAKVEQEPIVSLVNEVVYVVSDKGAKAAELVSRWPEKEVIVFIDDLLENCLSVHVAVPRAHCFLIRRENEAPQDILDLSGITLVQSLAEVEAHLAGL